jgi:hemerythrin-like domain-containing protein
MTRVTFDGREMYMVHDMFRREFGLMPGTVRAAAAEDYDRAQVVGEHIDMVTAALHHHHGAEDTYVWPLLRGRGGGELQPLVELMEAQHAGVAKLGREVDEALETWCERPTARSRDALAEALDRLVPALKDHLAMEEEHIVPLMEKHITTMEWGEVVQEIATHMDPETLRGRRGRAGEHAVRSRSGHRAGRAAGLRRARAADPRNGHAAAEHRPVTGRAVHPGRSPRGRTASRPARRSSPVSCSPRAMASSTASETLTLRPRSSRMWAGWYGPLT